MPVPAAFQQPRALLRFTMKDYKRRLDLEIMLLLVRSKHPNNCPRTMKIDFLDIVEKYGIDPLTDCP